MALFFFDTSDGKFVNVDVEGVELDSAQAARREALAGLADMVDGSLTHDQQRFSISVRDDNNEVIYIASLTLSGGWRGRGAENTVCDQMPPDL